MKFFLLLIVSFSLISNVLADDCLQASKNIQSGIQKIQAGKTANRSETIDLFRQAISLCPSMPEGYYNLGLVLMQDNNLPEALENALRAVELQVSPRNLLLLGNLQCLLRDYPAAAKAYKDVLEKDGDNIKALQGLGVVYQAQGQFQEAEDVLRQSIQQDPNNAEDYFNLGLILKNVNRFDEGLVSFRTAVEKNPNFAEAWLELGRLALHEDRLSEAETAVEKAILHAPKDPYVWMLSASINEAKGNLKGAEKEFQKAYELLKNTGSTDVIDVEVNLAVVMVKRNKYEDGLNKLRALLDQVPDNPRVHSALGWAYLQKRELKLAEKHLVEALQKDDSAAVAHNNYALLLELKRESEKAKQEFERAYKLNPKLNK